MKKFFARLIRFWNEDRRLNIMLLLLLFFIFVFSPLLRSNANEHIIIKFAYSAILLTGIYLLQGAKEL